MKREIEGQMNTFLINHQDVGNIYSGVSKQIPSSLNFLNSDYLQKVNLQKGLTIKYVTENTGEYEIIAYPVDFGLLSNISQNTIDINILEAWDMIQLKKGVRDYYVYYTSLPQFGDRSIFKFQL